MGLRLRHTSLFLTYVLAPLCAISNFNYEQVNPRNFPAAMLLHGRLSFRKPVLPSPSSGLVHRAFPISPIIARPRESRVISSIFSPIHFAMLPLRCVILDVDIPPPSFHKHFPLYHTLHIARTCRLWLCGQRRRACGAQQTPYIAVWWCSALSKYFGIYRVLSVQLIRNPQFC